jgi:hypothetical protein
MDRELTGPILFPLPIYTPSDSRASALEYIPFQAPFATRQSWDELSCGVRDQRISLDHCQVETEPDDCPA